MAPSGSDALLAKDILRAVVFALSPLQGVAREKQILDVKELTGSWHGWITRDEGPGPRNTVRLGGRKLPRLDDTWRDHRGKVLCERRQLALSLVAHHGGGESLRRSGTTTLTVMPADPKYHTGRARYERVKE
jgi:hypothetical protein